MALVRGALARQVYNSWAEQAWDIEVPRSDRDIDPIYPRYKSANCTAWGPYRADPKRYPDADYSASNLSPSPSSCLWHALALSHFCGMHLHCLVSVACTRTGWE